MKTTLFILALIISISIGKAQTNHQVFYFSLQGVKLLNNPFLQAQQTDSHYILALDPDRLSAPFLHEAGPTPKAPSYINWEDTGLDGHIGGRYLSALPTTYAAIGDAAIYHRLNYILNELRHAQQAVGIELIEGTPGNLQPWKEIKASDIRAGDFSLNDKWVSLYNIHKTYARLRDAYLYAHSDLTRQMLVDSTDWMVDITFGLSDSQMQDMFRSEHSGLNETFVDVAEVIGDKKYLKLVRRFFHKVILDPLIKNKDRLNGMYANIWIPKVIGYKQVAEVSKNDKNWNHAAEWDHAAHSFRNTVANHRSVCIGGNSVREHLRPSDNFTSMLDNVQGPETCNTYNILRLTRMFYQNSGNVNNSNKPDPCYVDYYERALYNYIPSSQELDKDGFVYFTLMRPGHYRVYLQPETSMWYHVGSDLGNHTKYGESIYAHQQDTLHINLFILPQPNWKEQGVTLTQETLFPDDEKVILRIDKAAKKNLTLMIRMPEWTGNSKGYEIAISDEEHLSGIQTGVSTYLPIRRKQKEGDMTTFHLSMKVSLEQIPDKKNCYAFLCSPIVLATSIGTENLDEVYADDSRDGHTAYSRQTPLQKIPMLIGSPDSIRRSPHKLNGSKLAFSYDGDVCPTRRSKSLESVPFFRLHNSRYAVYFRQASEEQFKAVQKEMATAERKAIDLADRTVDSVFSGEQQPESDHGILYETSETGTHKDRHFRRVRGRFSYNLKVKEEASQLMITIRQEDRNKAVILLNNKKLTVHPTTNKADKDGFIKLCYLLPHKLKAGSCEVLFRPDGAEWAPAVYGVCLLR